MKEMVNSGVQNKRIISSVSASLINVSEAKGAAKRNIFFSALTEEHRDRLASGAAGKCPKEC